MLTKDGTGDGHTVFIEELPLCIAVNTYVWIQAQDFAAPKAFPLFFISDVNIGIPVSQS